MALRFLIVSILLVSVCLSIPLILESTALNSNAFTSEGEGHVMITTDISSNIIVRDEHGKIIHNEHLYPDSSLDLSLPEGKYIIEGTPTGLSPIPYSSTSVLVSVKSGEYYRVHLSYGYSMIFISLVIAAPASIVPFIAYFSVKSKKKKYLKRLEDLIRKLEELESKVMEIDIRDITMRHSELLNRAKNLAGKSLRELSAGISSLERSYTELEEEVEEYYGKLAEYQNLKKQVLEKIDKLISSLNDLLG